MRDSTIVTESPASPYANLAEMLSDENLELRIENTGLTNDLSWCRELLAAAIDKLHEAHVDRLEQQRKYHRLLDELRAIRAAHRVDVSASVHLPERVTGDNDPAGAPCH